MLLSHKKIVEIMWKFVSKYRSKDKKYLEISTFVQGFAAIVSRETLHIFL